MTPDPVTNPGKNPESLRDGIENAVVICGQIAAGLSLISRSQELEDAGDAVGAIVALATLAGHTADRIDNLIHLLPTDP